MWPRAVRTTQGAYTFRSIYGVVMDTKIWIRRYRSSTKYEEGQLWLISFFRQLLTTKVTTAQWFCGSITPTHEWPRSWSAEETLNLNTHCILPQRWECSEGHCKKIMWRMGRYKTNVQGLPHNPDSLNSKSNFIRSNYYQIPDLRSVLRSK